MRHQRFDLVPQRLVSLARLRNERVALGRVARQCLVENPLNRYSISARQDLKANPDGSIDLYIQKDSPSKDRESNWLPAPSGDFILMARLCWPTEKSPSIINGSWKVPPVKKV